jgi:hypothetical protein
MSTTADQSSLKGGSASFDEVLALVGFAKSGFEISIARNFPALVRST